MALSSSSRVSSSRASRRSNVRASAAAKRDPSQRIVITGMGVASVFGTDPSKFYEHLLAGDSGVKTIDRFDPEAFPTRFAAQITDFDVEGIIDHKNNRRMDDCLRYALVSGKKAMMSAGIEIGNEAFEKLNKDRCGVLIGSGMGGLTVFQDGVTNLVTKGVKKISPFFIPYAITNMGGALLAIDAGFTGPNYSISTACATSNYAFHAAATHIRNGDADLIVCGGAEAPIIPVGLGGFVACRALSTRNDEPHLASRPWDKNRDGFVMGEGAGVLVMESLEHAMARGAPIVAEYLGGAINCDAHNMTDPRPDGSGVAACMELAIKDAGIDKDMINYINGHATSTPVGDLCEVRAIKSCFSGDTSHMKMNATKSMVGHCLGAAAGVEAVAVLKAIETGYLHPTLNQDDIEDEVSIDTCASGKVHHPVTAALSNSFGFGGHNSAVIFAPFEE